MGGGILASVATPDGDQLDVYESFARTCLEPRLGPMRLVDRRGGPPGMHDFETGPVGAPTAAIEVTSEVDAYPTWGNEWTVGPPDGRG